MCYKPTFGVTNQTKTEDTKMEKFVNKDPPQRII